MWTRCSKVRSTTTESQYSPVWLKQARSVGRLLYGTGVLTLLAAWLMIISLEIAHTEVPARKKAIRTLEFTSRLPRHIMIYNSELK